jgi:predicted cupin superfamily sugar epimerase
MFRTPLLARIVSLLAVATVVTVISASPPSALRVLPVSERSGPNGYRGGSVASHSAAEVVAKLNLIANPEKGYFVQTFEDPLIVNGNRSASTAIYYLLEGSVGWSYWHRIDAVEVWHYYAGAPMKMALSYDNGTATQVTTLGREIFQGEVPQVSIAKWQWQHVKSLGDWTLVGTTGMLLACCRCWLSLAVTD